MAWIKLRLAYPDHTFQKRRSMRNTPQNTEELVTSTSGATFAIETHLNSSIENGLCLIWLHGWGQTSRSLQPLASVFSEVADNILIDLPGFGKAPPPPGAWGTEEYADALAEILRLRSNQQRIVIGHSFGGRVGIQLAARHQDLLAGLVIIAGAGLPANRSFVKQVKLFAIKTALRATRWLDLMLRSRIQSHVAGKLGSVDYRNAGVLRPTLVKVVNENLTQVASTVAVPTLLLYGSEDRDTPPTMGMRFNKLISNSTLTILPHFDHLGILDAGRFQVQILIREFLQVVQRQLTSPS